MRFVERLTWVECAMAVLQVVCCAQERAAGAKPGEAGVKDDVVDTILTRLEGRKIDDLHAKVVWESKYALEEDKDATKLLGEIWYRDEQPVAKFKVHFDYKITGNRKEKYNEQHLFDGRWYTELNAEKSKVITKHEMRRETDTSNPYKIGEGSFPVPFGQKKADILAEFEVSRTPAAADDPENTDHLRLIPRPGTNTSQSYKWVDFWVAREGKQSGLPVKVRTAKKDPNGAVNSTITVTFSDPELNTGLSGSIFKIETPPGFEISVEPLDAVDGKSKKAG